MADVPTVEGVVGMLFDQAVSFYEVEGRRDREAVFGARAMMIEEDGTTWMSYFENAWFRDDDTKTRLFFDEIPALIREKHPALYAFVHEVWLVQVELNEDGSSPDVTPAEDPARKEMLQVHVVERASGSSQVYARHVLRRDNEVLLGESEFIGEGTAVRGRIYAGAVAAMLDIPVADDDDGPLMAAAETLSRETQHALLDAIMLATGRGSAEAFSETLGDLSPADTLRAWRSFWEDFRALGVERQREVFAEVCGAEFVERVEAEGEDVR